MVLHARDLLCKLFMRKNQNKFFSQNKGRAQPIDEITSMQQQIYIYTQTRTHSIEMFKVQSGQIH